MRFIPNSEMVGFMTGVAVLIILGQLADLTGYTSDYGNKVIRAIDLLFNLNQVHLQTLTVGLTAIILIIVLEKTRLGGLGMVVAIIVASILPSLFGWGTVARVSDIAEMTGSSRPALPDFSEWTSLIIPAVSLSVIALIQGAGVSQAYVNPDGRYPKASRDFIGQGAANVAAGIFQGMPVGGSVSATALVVDTGAGPAWRTSSAASSSPSSPCCLPAPSASSPCPPLPASLSWSASGSSSRATCSPSGGRGTLSERSWWSPSPWSSWCRCSTPSWPAWSSPASSTSSASRTASP